MLVLCLFSTHQDQQSHGLHARSLLDIARAGIEAVSDIARSPSIHDLRSDANPTPLLTLGATVKQLVPSEET
jgi:hypothetical protein